jgi:pyruvate kinase
MSTSTQIYEILALIIVIGIIIVIPKPKYNVTRIIEPSASITQDVSCVGYLGASYTQALVAATNTVRAVKMGDIIYCYDGTMERVVKEVDGGWYRVQWTMSNSVAYRPRSTKLEWRLYSFRFPTAREAQEWIIANNKSEFERYKLKNTPVQLISE